MTTSSFERCPEGTDDLYTVALSEIKVYVGTLSQFSNPTKKDRHNKTVLVEIQSIMEEIKCVGY